MKKTKTSNKKKNDDGKRDACSLCGQLYNNFAFKGGYVCEHCLSSIKDEEEPPCSKKE